MTIMGYEHIEVIWDLATSITIIGAAISFLISQRKSRKQHKDTFAFEKVQEVISLFSDAGIENDILVGRREYNEDKLEEAKKAKDELEIAKISNDIKDGLDKTNYIFSDLYAKLMIKRHIFKIFATEEELVVLKDSIVFAELLKEDMDKHLGDFPEKIEKLVEILKPRYEAMKG